jgi:DnaJ-domain-containing protein 1
MTKEELAALKIPEEFHANPTLLEAKDVPALAKMLIDTKAHVGASIRIPGADAGDEDKKAFREKLQKAVPDLVEIPSDPTKFAEAEGMIFEKLGRPKDMKEYPSLKDAKIELPDGLKIEEAELRAYAHGLGMTKKQFIAFAKNAVAEKIKVSQMTSEARKALKAELGDAFDERLQAAALAAKKHGADDALVDAIRTGNIPASQAKLWIGVAKTTGTEGGNFNPEGGGSQRMTPAEALAQIDELYRNPALMQRNHPENKRLTEKLVDLHRIAHPD